MIYKFASYERLSLDENNTLTADNYVYPIWAEVLGNIMNLAIVMSMIAYAIYSVFDAVKYKKVWLRYIKYFF